MRLQEKTNGPRLDQMVLDSAEFVAVQVVLGLIHYPEHYFALWERIPC